MDYIGFKNSDVIKEVIISGLGLIEFKDYKTSYGELNLIEFKCEKGAISLIFSHYQDCCEQTYASPEYFENGETPILKIKDVDKLTIELVERLGIRINTHLIPCYDIQNGYYNSEIDLSIFIKDSEGNLIESSEGELSVTAEFQHEDY